MLDVQTIITDALLKVGAMSPQDAGNPDPELQVIAVRELNMLLSELGLSMAFNINRRTYSFTPQSGDRITFGSVGSDILSATYQQLVPASAPYTYQLPNTNIQDITVTLVDLNQEMTIETNVGPTAEGTVLIDYTSGLLTFHNADAGKLVVIQYHWASSTPTHPDIAERVNNVISLQYEMAGIVYGCKQISYDQYQSISLKKDVITIPQWYAWDFQFPNPTLWIFPYMVSGMTARLVSQRPYLAAVDGAELDVPDYMYKYLVYNLATQLYTTYRTGNGLDQETIYHAKASAANIKAYISRQNMTKAKGDYKRRSSRSIWTDLGSPLGGYAPGALR